MRSVLLVSLVLLATTAQATIYRSLNELGSVPHNTINVDAAYPDTTAPILLEFTGPATYMASAYANIDPITAVVAWSSNVTWDRAAVTFTNPAEIRDVDMTAGVDDGANQTTFIIDFPLLFTTAGSYSVSLQVLSSVGEVRTLTIAGGYDTLQVSNPVTQRTVRDYNVSTIQDFGCSDDTCAGTNGPVGFIKFNIGTGEACGQLNSFNGAVFDFCASYSSGNANFFTGNAPVIKYGGEVLGNAIVRAVEKVGITRLPKSVPLNNTVYWSDSVSGYLFAAKGVYPNVQSTVGSNDRTPPSCTFEITAAADTVKTGSTTVSVPVHATCTDADSGVWASGAFFQADADAGYSGVQPIELTAGSGAVMIPPYVSGTIKLIGVWAIDNDGNAVVYGTCGSITGFASICTGGDGGGFQSPASQLAVSVFGLVSLLALALFA